MLLATNAVFGQFRPLQTTAVRSVQGFCRGQRIGKLAEYIRGQGRIAGKDDEGFRCARARQSGKIQRLDAADRDHAAIADGGSENPRQSAEAGGRGIQGRRRCDRGAARRHGAMCSGSLAPSMPHIKSGALRCLAVCCARRAGRICRMCRRWRRPAIKDFVFATDCVLLAPVKTPPANVKWLEAETLKVSGDAGHEGQALPGGFLVRAERRRRGLGAGDQGNRTCSSRSSTRPASRSCRAGCPSVSHRTARAPWRGRSVDERAPARTELMRASGVLLRNQVGASTCDQDRIKGSAEQAAGKVKEWTGKATGDAKTESRRQGRPGERQNPECRRRPEGRRPRQITPFAQDLAKAGSRTRIASGGALLRTRRLSASGGAATAIARDIGGPSLRSRW